MEEKEEVAKEEEEPTKEEPEPEEEEEEEETKKPAWSWDMLKTDKPSIFPTTPEVWSLRKSMFSTKGISVFVVIFGLYMVIMYTFQPIAFGPISWRPSDMLIMFCTLLGYPAAWGVTMGTLFFSGLFGYGWVDGIKSFVMFIVSYPILIEVYKHVDPKVESLWKLLVIGGLFNVYTVTYVGIYLWIVGVIPGYPHNLLPALGLFWIGTGPGTLFNRLIATPIFIVALKRAGCHFLPMEME